MKHERIQEFIGHHAPLEVYFLFYLKIFDMKSMKIFNGSMMIYQISREHETKNFKLSWYLKTDNLADSWYRFEIKTKITISKSKSITTMINIELWIISVGLIILFIARLYLCDIKFIEVSIILFSFALISSSKFSFSLLYDGQMVKITMD